MKAMTTYSPGADDVDTSKWKDTNCYDCTFCKVVTPDKKLISWLDVKGCTVNCIGPSGKVYPIEGEKIKGKQLATCTKGYWPRMAIANPQQMLSLLSDSNRPKSNWFYKFAADCADFAGEPPLAD